ncbi:hypothetical protein [Deinococcus sp.]|uniref:competence protein CoiA family protein n=1 Tax=Deinococcus sp. TaxID=47478 RepID=UPI003C7EC026
MALAVPYALNDHQRLIRPEGGVLHGSYRCLQCQERVYFKPGKKYRSHFYHAAGAACTGESVLHLAAKQALVEGLPGLSELGVLLPCRRAGCPDLHVAVWTLPPFDTILAEVPLGSYRLDVALMQQGEVVAAIEVFQTHRIGEQKGQDLTVPWIEVRADTVLENLVLLQPVVGQTVAKTKLRALRPSSLSLTYMSLFFDQLTHYGNLMFHARQAEQTVVPDYLCEPCSREWASELKRRITRHNVAAADRGRGEEYQRALELQPILREQARLEQEERLRLAEMERARQQEADRTENQLRAERQQAKYGTKLRQPMSHRAELFLEAHPQYIRFMLEYLRAELRDFQLLEEDGRCLTIKPCQHCRKQIVLLDTTTFFGKLWPYGRLLAYWKKAGATRGWVFNVCQHCQKWQKVREDTAVKAATSLDGSVFLDILRAFGQVPVTRSGRSSSIE